jgi:hypothetical protein
LSLVQLASVAVIKRTNRDSIFFFMIPKLTASIS